MSMLPGSFTVPRLTPSSSSLAGTMPPFPGAARGGLTDSLALKPGSFSRFFQQAAVNLPAHACLCCAVDEQEELASQQHLPPCKAAAAHPRSLRVSAVYSFVRARMDKLMGLTSHGLCGSLDLAVD